MFQKNCPEWTLGEQVVFLMDQDNHCVADCRAVYLPSGQRPLSNCQSRGALTVQSVALTKICGIASWRTIVLACTARELSMRVRCAVAVSVTLGSLLSLAQNDNAPHERSASATTDNSYARVLSFDPNRDALADIQSAIAEAQRTGKRIILDVGGDWCPYCREMNKFFLDNPDVLQFREENFITLAIFYSSDNKNEKALSQYPKVLGIPHFFVLEGDGTLLHSQHVKELRMNGSYDIRKMKDFLTKWAPVPRANDKRSTQRLSTRAPGALRVIEPPRPNRRSFPRRQDERNES